MKKLVLLAMPLMAISLLASCGGGDKPAPEPKEEFTVTFDANGGTLDSGASMSIDVKDGTLFGEISNIDKQTATKEGNFTFAGWGLSPNTPDVIGDEYTITKDFTVYAVYTPYATASIKLSNDSNNCYLYYKGTPYNAGSTFDIPAGTNVTMTVETNEGYLPVFKEKLSFTGEHSSEFDSIKHEITVNVNASSTCTIKATTTTPEEKGTLENYSWSEISQLSEMGLADELFDIGEEKTVNLFDISANTNTRTEQSFAHTVRIIGFNHDYSELPDEGNPDPSKVLGITFEFENVITKGVDVPTDAYTTIWNGVYRTSGDNYDYRESVINNVLNNKTDGIDSVINRLPDDLRDAIKPVDKKVGVSTDEGQNYIATSFDGETHSYPYLFLLAHNEIADNERYVTKDEGTKYQYYEEHTDQNDRIKRKVGIESGNGEDYWLRSPDAGYSSYAWRVSIGGTLYSDHYVYYVAYAVAPAFCI